MTNQIEVRELHYLMPWLTYREAAYRLKCTQEYVRAACRRMGITFASVQKPKRYRETMNDMKDLLESEPGSVVQLYAMPNGSTVSLFVTKDTRVQAMAWMPEDAIRLMLDRVKVK